MSRQSSGLVERVLLKGFFKMSALRIMMIIAPDQFRDEELLVPRQAFIQKGFEVTTISTKTGEAKGMLGAIESISKTLEDIDLSAERLPYEAVVVMGGMGSPQFLFHNPRLHTLLQKANEQGSIVAGICLSGALPALAGVAQGKRCTVYETPDSLEALKQGGARYTGESVTVDGNVITANGPEAAEAFAAEIVQALNKLAPVPLGR